jgi:hypothetical protein
MRQIVALSVAVVAASVMTASASARLTLEAGATWTASAPNLSVYADVVAPSAVADRPGFTSEMRQTMRSARARLALVPSLQGAEQPRTLAYFFQGCVAWYKTPYAAHEWYLGGGFIYEYYCDWTHVLEAGDRWRAYYVWNGSQWIHYGTRYFYSWSQYCTAWYSVFDRQWVGPTCDFG